MQAPRDKDPSRAPPPPPDEPIQASPAGAETEQNATGKQSSTLALEKWQRFGLDAGNWISLVALCIAVGTAAWQTGGYFVGPDLAFIPPTSVTFRYSPYGGRSSLALSATTMNYVNEGRKDYDGLVLDEQVSLQLTAANPTVLNWWWFLGPDGTATEQAHPVVVPGAGLAAHETRFAPFVQSCSVQQVCTEAHAYRNFFSWSLFLKTAADATQLPHIDLLFTVRMRERKTRTFEYKCRVELDDRIRAVMKDQYTLLTKYQNGGMTPEAIGDQVGFRNYFSLPCGAL